LILHQKSKIVNNRQRISQSEIRKITAAKKEAAKARAGKNSLPVGRQASPNPLPFCRPTCHAEALAQAERNFSEIVGGIFLKMSSNFI
jgi:hypothetical protein